MDVLDWVHFGCKRGLICADLRRFNKKGLWTLNPQPFYFVGAGGGNRTRMGLRPEDFEQPVFMIYVFDFSSFYFWLGAIWVHLTRCQ